MKKRARITPDKAVPNVWQREVGELSTRSFAHRLAASEDLVLRLEIYKKLEKHRGCVNTVSFNADGDVLVSGSDDRRVILWDWETGRIKLSFHSGHNNNVFQAKIMPYTDDRSIVTCAADGQVRRAQILEHTVETALLAKHQGRAHKLAIEPGSPHIFYTCGEDGLVQHFDLRTRRATELFTCQPIEDRKNYTPVVHLNAISIDPRNPNLFAVAGTDEYTRVYDVRMYKWDGSTEFGRPTDYFCPPHLIGDEQVGITGLSFSDQSELLVSYNDEFIYLFTRDMGLGLNPDLSSSVCSDASEMGPVDADGKPTPQVYKGHRNCETVKGVSFFGPGCEYVVSGSDCGRIFIWKKKGGELIRVMEADKHVVNCIEPHPHITGLASSGIETDIKIWTPKAFERATLPANIEKVLRFDRIPWFGDEDDDNDDDYFSDDEDDDDGNDDDDDDNDDDDDDDDDGNDDDANDSGGDADDDTDDDYNDDDCDGDIDNFVDGYDDANDDSDLHFLCSAETEG
ncbi:DDB1- and CUL4-associated factor 8 isoform X2 [Manihot esculenta]|uniref:Uncharacterized protein n=1 Tax=Manihot esculenta TaxID=3983 RepID=A0A2C9W0D6_MANES|nr:DDB1- and CUL4-associated factor 8 isoform X2 [Manihot esculenta]OAY52276.1 hypothetical protein MANES_04G070200v8 [Manihot esculenta]